MVYVRTSTLNTIVETVDQNSGTAVIQNRWVRDREERIGWPFEVYSSAVGCGPFPIACFTPTRTGPSSHIDLNCLSSMWRSSFPSPIGVMHSTM